MKTTRRSRPVCVPDPKHCGRTARYEVLLSRHVCAVCGKKV
jgi:hypothetical protein